MQMTVLFALALVIRVLTPSGGAVECPLSPGQQIVAAYSAEYEHVWHHAVPTTIVDRVVAARSGRVTGLGQDDRLVLAISDENAAFDASRPQPDVPETFPYAPELVRAYERLTGRDYVRDMMIVASPTLGSQLRSAASVADMYETIFAAGDGRASAFRTFGSGEAGNVLVLTSRTRIWCWLDRCFGDDGAAYAKALAEKGFRVDLSDRDAFSRMSVDADGFVTADGRRYGTLVIRHLSRPDADRCRRVLGNRPLATKVHATDAPIIHGAEIVWSDPLF